MTWDMSRDLYVCGIGWWVVDRVGDHYWSSLWSVLGRWLLYRVGDLLLLLTVAPRLLLTAFHDDDVLVADVSGCLVWYDKWL